MSFLKNLFSKQSSQPPVNQRTSQGAQFQCPDCAGVGIPSKQGNGLCYTCKGSGSGMPTLVETMNGIMPKCETCRGTGKCQTCGGTGYVASQPPTALSPSLREVAQDENSIRTLEKAFEMLMTNLPDADRSAKLESLLGSRSDLIRLKNEAGTTLLHIAATTDPQTVQLLISRGADVNIRSRDGWTALHFLAIRSPGESKAIAIATALLSSGADVNAKTNDGKTPLGTLMEYERKGELAKLFRQHGGSE